MNLQDFSREEVAAAPLDMMAAWRACGGAAETLDEVDEQTALRTRSRRAGRFGDDGLHATMNTALASCADDGLRATMNTALASCLDDGLHATMNTALASCADDGLHATMNTALASCVDDGLQAGHPTMMMTCY